ncbi:MAG: Gfo/Idh/MocA family oxidoreductase [Candidatus Latescibacteria bacterium]|nr:Gfo/Idh/MocA family oxidoreductase [Candidatus Latescibacterota bacterium]
MDTRRSFMKKTAIGGIAGILSAGKAPAFAQDMKLLKLSKLGLGSHNFLSSFKNPPKNFAKPVQCKPYAVWDDIPEVAEAMKGDLFEKVIHDPVEIIRESDGVLVMHADYRKVFELAQPALEMGKPVFINRPFTATIADAQETVRLAQAYDTPLMSASSLEFQPECEEMGQFIIDKGPLRAYEAYCMEPHFTWHFPHVINYAHAALGGGIDTAYFAGDYVMELRKWTIDKQPIGSSLCVLTYKSRNGEPSIIGMNHCGAQPGGYHIDVYAAQENKLFECDVKTLFDHMFIALHDFFVNRKIPRPYEAILEQHRALVAANVSRITGRAVKLDSLDADDALPYSEGIRRYIVNRILQKKQ